MSSPLNPLVQTQILRLVGDIKISNSSISPLTVRLIDILVDAHIVSSRSEYIRHAVLNFLTGRLQLNPLHAAKIVIEDPTEIRIAKPDGGYYIYNLKEKGAKI